MVTGGENRRREPLKRNRLGGVGSLASAAWSGAGGSHWRNGGTAVRVGVTGTGVGAVAAVGCSLVFSGRLILALPANSRMPSFNSMFLPGTMAEATRKTFSSVSGGLRSQRLLGGGDAVGLLPADRR